MTDDAPDCALCGCPAPWSKGHYFANLRLRTCQGACAAWVLQCVRVYDRSKRGRYRPRAEVRHLVAVRRGFFMAGLGFDQLWDIEDMLALVSRLPELPDPPQSTPT